jgi:hypothetical protein
MLEILAINLMLGGNSDLMQQCWFFVFLLALLIRQCNFVFSALFRVKQVSQFQVAKTTNSGNTMQNR